MSRRLKGKEYVGCLIQILQVLTGIIAIIVFIRQCPGGWYDVANCRNCTDCIRCSWVHFAASQYSGKPDGKRRKQL